MRRREFIALLGGAAATWPLTARAQRPAMPVVGVLDTGSLGQLASHTAALLQGLSEAGYVAGQNVAIEHRWAEGHYDRLPALAADLVSHKVDVIVAVYFPSALAAKRATSTIPIVFSCGIDPVEAGLVANFARPGGNLTGVSFMVVELAAKRLDLVSELLPQSSVIALLVNPTNPNAERTTGLMQAAAQTKGVQLSILRAGNEGEIDNVFTSSSHCAPRHSLSVAMGSSLAGTNSSWRWHRGMPFQRSMRGANSPPLAAWALGLTIPSTLLVRADEVIE